MKKFTNLLYITVAMIPSVAFAQLTGIGGLVTASGQIIQRATVVVAALALLTFFWGLVKFITKVGGDAKAAAEGKSLMIWGVIALFVMVSIWGMIYFIGAQLFPSYGWDQYEAPPIPTFYTP